MAMDSIARKMADALAIMRWKAQMDANDVESVCGAALSVRVTQRYFDSHNE